ncbi:hypothetical protein MVEN_01430500 [Mycena venus]|uniref:Uncharacterized protein n=1 Tax=Mycena venus TaxID=2733690 RepID=A0A8H6XZJ6_9AGAR|nr:hypothetical protein MVEN_01430500 [Mycena venus]
MHATRLLRARSGALPRSRPHVFHSHGDHPLTSACAPLTAALVHLLPPVLPHAAAGAPLCRPLLRHAARPPPHCRRSPQYCGACTTLLKGMLYTSFRPSFDKQNDGRRVTDRYRRGPVKTTAMPIDGTAPTVNIIVDSSPTSSPSPRRSHAWSTERTYTCTQLPKRDAGDFQAKTVPSQRGLSQSGIPRIPLHALISHPYQGNGSAPPPSDTLDVASWAQSNPSSDLENRLIDVHPPDGTLDLAVWLQSAASA